LWLGTPDLPSAGWNVLREDILPMCALLDTALERNLTQLQRFTDESGALLAPHGRQGCGHRTRLTAPGPGRPGRSQVDHPEPLVVGVVVSSRQPSIA
jgi:hypothetical protein